MIDNVTLKVYNLPKNYKLCKKAKIEYKSDVNTYKCKIKNMVIWQNLDCLTILGSLAKYLRDENITPLNREQIRQAIKKLEQDIGLSLKNAVVCSVEFGTSIITKEKPFEYLSLFGNTKRLTRVEYSKMTGIETILYTSDTGSFEFIGYDKIKEMKKRKQDIPQPFVNSNVLRLEYKIRAKRGIEAKFKGGLSAYSLLGGNVYKRFQELFLDCYKNIGKMGRLVYADKSEEITPLVLCKLMAEQYRQSHTKMYRYFMQQIIEAGKISPRNLERIRAENYKLENDIYISEQSPLIKELDAYVCDRVMFGD
jgi:replication initiation and membrane attachment protein DnaB